MQDPNRSVEEITLEQTQKKVVYYSFIKAKEMREATIKTDDANTTTDKLLKILVVSIDDSDEDILNKVLDLPLSDYHQLSTALTALISTAIPEKKN